MIQELRTEHGACIFCGQVAIAADAPCQCKEAMEERRYRNALKDGETKLSALCAPNADGWREQTSEEEFSALLGLLEPVAREVLHKITVNLPNGTKAMLKADGDKIEVTREEGKKSATLSR